MKTKMPKIEDYYRIKMRLISDGKIPANEIEESAIAISILDANGEMKERALIDAMADFSMEIGLWEALRDGRITVVGCEGGEVKYAMTDAGRKYVESKFIDPKEIP